MSDQVEYRDVEQIIVSIDGSEVSWTLEERLEEGSRWTLVMTSPDGATWTGTGQGLWSAFVDLRHQTDRLGYRLCCAGARIDANMRNGRWANSDLVDILSRRTLLGIRHKASLLAYAPASKVGTVEEQEARYTRWLATPWWRAFWPGDPAG